MDVTLTWKMSVNDETNINVDPHFGYCTKSRNIYLLKKINVLQPTFLANWIDFVLTTMSLEVNGSVLTFYVHRLFKRLIVFFLLLDFSENGSE